MCSRFLSLFFGAVIAVWATDAQALRICSDPNNLPFSNQAQEGFENRIATLLARDLNVPVQYVWRPEGKAFVENTLGQSLCDVWMGVPDGMDGMLTTQPYYRSSYVLVWRKDRALGVSSLDDPRLAQWRIGIHVVGDNYAPPASALTRRGLAANLVPFSLLGTPGEASPPARLLEAVAHGDVDVGVAWGPMAGYFAQHSARPLVIQPVSPAQFMGVPFTFDISMGVRTGDKVLLADVNRALARNCRAIEMILAEFAVPLVGEGQAQCGGSPLQRSAVWH